MKRATIVAAAITILGFAVCDMGKASASGTAGVEAPLLKEGLWSIHSKTTENPGDKTSEGNQSLCRNHAYDDYVRGLTKNVQCKTTTHFTGGVLNTESECTVAGSVIRTKGTATIGAEAAHSESHTTYTPPAYGVSESTMIMDQKYLGSCPAGMEPGDVAASDGKIVRRWKH